MKCIKYFAKSTIYAKKRQTTKLLTNLCIIQSLKDMKKYQSTVDESYPQHDSHTMHVGKMLKALIKDAEIVLFLFYQGC